MHNTPVREVAAIARQLKIAGRNFADISICHEGYRERISGDRNGILNKSLQTTREIKQKVSFKRTAENKETIKCVYERHKNNCTN